MARLITIHARSATGFRRSGVHFTPEPQVFDCMAFSPCELDALLAEPALICVLSDEQLDLDPPAATPGTANAGDAEGDSDAQDDTTEEKAGSDDAAAAADKEVVKSEPAGRGRRSAPAG